MCRRSVFLEGLLLGLGGVFLGGTWVGDSRNFGIAWTNAFGWDIEF